MLSDHDLQELLHYSSREPMLSVYLNTDPAHGGNEDLKLQLNTLLGEVDLPDDKTVVVKYFESLRDARGRGLAIFSNIKEGFVRSYRLAVPVRSRVFVGDHPYVKPLADLLDVYGNYGVVLVDKQGARLFHFHLGDLVEQEGTLGEEIHHTKGRASSSSPGGRSGFSSQPRNNDEVSNRNIRESVEFAMKFFEKEHTRRILIGGTDENVAQFRRYLPKAWQSLVMGTFAMSMSALPAEVLARAMETGQQAERRREEHLVESMLTAAAKGKEGVVGLANTLEAVHAGRVSTLIVQEGLRSPAYQCKGCGHLLVQATEVCQFCGKRFEKIEDAVEMVVRKVMQTGGAVDIVRDNEHLKEVGIGALLRY